MDKGKPCVAAGAVHDFFADTQMPCEACGPKRKEPMMIAVCESCGAEVHQAERDKAQARLGEMREAVVVANEALEQYMESHDPSATLTSVRSLLKRLATLAEES